ncbi:hypothetical protein WG66_006486, partial [Moniliophthora roreri]
LTFLLFPILPVSLLPNLFEFSEAIGCLQTVPEVKEL